MDNTDNGQISGISFILSLLVCNGVNEEAPFPVLFLGVGCRKVLKAKRFIPFEISQYKSAAFMRIVFFTMG